LSAESLPLPAVTPMKYKTHRLPNGIRLIHQEVQSPVAHCGIIINTGSRDELPEEHGLAHFIEHVLFKGTGKRKAWHIISRLEDVGGDLNAYTTKEETCIHASFLKEYTERAMELIADLVFNSVFPPKEVEKEKDIVLDEINSYLDNPAELIFDEFEELIYEHNSIGRGILGTPASVKSFTKEMVQSFMQCNYHTDQMVITSVGQIEFSLMVKWFSKYFGHIPANLRNYKRAEITGYTASNRTISKDTFQAHCIIGNTAYALDDSRRIGLHLLNNILGGPNMNSRLNLSLRERSGYTYSVEATYTPYTNSGSLVIYFGTDKQYLQRSTELAMKEINTLRNRKLGTLQLFRAQRQLIGQLAISSENNESQMLSIGKSFLIFNKVDSLETVNKKIEALTSTQLTEIANDILAEQKLSVLVYQ
jgi:predicted Zn-dependent peptidase